jgi:hypothetical protein
MNMIFFHIKKDKQPQISGAIETFTYHEFKAELGLIGYLKGYRAFTDNIYKTFISHDAALHYAKERGGVDAYSY